MIHNLRHPESLPLSHLADTWHLLGNQPDRIEALRDLLGPVPAGFEKPDYGTPQYALAARCGWISPRMSRPTARRGRNAARVPCKHATATRFMNARARPCRKRVALTSQRWPRGSRTTPT